jgi:nucleotide-binding universal stress UspA family protein
VIGPQWAERHRAVQVVKVGYAVEEIVKYAKDQEIDLIVIGTHGHTGFAHLLLGSIAEKVVRMATCPVLSVHPKDHPFVTVTATEQSALTATPAG